MNLFSTVTAVEHFITIDNDSYILNVQCTDRYNSIYEVTLKKLFMGKGFELIDTVRINEFGIIQQKEYSKLIKYLIDNVLLPDNTALMNCKKVLEQI